MDFSRISELVLFCFLAFTIPYCFILGIKLALIVADKLDDFFS